MSKRLLFAVTNDLTYDRRMYRICSSLAEAGYEVHLAGRRLNISKPFSPPTFQAHRLRCWFTKGPLFYAEYNIRLFFFLLIHRFDCFCACDLDTAVAVRLAGWLRNIKTVYDAHEYFTEVPELTGRPFVKRIWERIGKWTIPGFDARYTVGEELAVLMGKEYNVSFDVIRNIAPAPTTTPVDNDEPGPDKVLLYQGAINVGRGLHACIEAMQWLPGWQLWLAGEGDITDVLKEKAIAMNLEERIRFLGWIQPEALPGLMRKAYLAVNLREKGSLNDFYSLPNKFFDAIHAGLPSINMNYPEYAAVCRKYPCAILLDEVDPKKLADVILDFESHPERREQLIYGCMQAAKEFTWQNEAARLKTIYRKIVP
jgi:glycosyltransferase involved in cell wall biosynthesis